MVGPSRTVWKVLRETEGERFVVKKQSAQFSSRFAAASK
jgi:hypothetical protein